MATYLRVEWHHEHEDDPIVLYSEIEDGLETRKVDVYRNGRLDYADYKTQTGTTRLSEEVMPSLDEIAEQYEFSPSEITSDDFERLWLTATQPGFESRH